MAGKLPTRTLKPGTGPKPINARRPAKPAGGLTTPGGPFSGGGQNLPGGGAGVKGTPGYNYPVKPQPTPVGVLKASGAKPVGYGVNGNPFYKLSNYVQSKAFKRAGGHLPGGGGPEQPAMGNRVPGASTTFPHTGAAAAPNTADAHVEAVRVAMLRAGANGGGA